MDSKYHKILNSWWILILVAMLDTLSKSCVEGLRTLDNTNIGPMPKGTLKTIKVLEDGDVIDCVDFYKQPAFDNPLIKNLKMVPHLYASALNKTGYLLPKSFQTWNKYGKCPKGSIPIRRTWNNGTIHQKVYDDPDDPNTREFATAFHHGNKIQGGAGVFSVWKPIVQELNEFSSSQMWVVAGTNKKNTIEVGWTVHPQLFHDSVPRLFIYWTDNKYNKKGCYNLACPAFVQTSDEVTLGNGWDPASFYGGEQIVQRFRFYRAKDTEGGDWWLEVGEHVVGFYPRSLFPDLGDGADFISFGGEIVNLQTNNRHTETAMGSGFFSSAGFKRACSINHIEVKNEASTWVEANLQIQAITRPTCYDLTLGPQGTQLESHFYFGGPGFSPGCR